MTLRDGHWSGPYLRVDGDPFLVVGAEIHNSSSSSPAQILRSFEVVRQLGANTVLAPVAWDQLEPAEGEFDTTLIDTMISTASSLGLRLVPLWFGSWKNAVSTYVPAWVKKDTRRFPRAELARGLRVEHVSAFSLDARDADARAFAALMRRIHDRDTGRAVIAVQVENEVGLLGDTRDRSPLAEAAFRGQVPEAVIAAVEADPDMPVHTAWRAAGAPSSGTWSEVFGVGDATDEAFMAAGLAAYTGAVAAAGADEHDLPLFANAWLNTDSVLEGAGAFSGGKRPGDYPSGGPVLSVAPIWEALAPSLDLLAPDVYLHDAEPVLAGYAARRGRLLVPEIRADARGIAQMFSAVGRHRAAGVAPFGVDGLEPGALSSLAVQDALRLLSAVAQLIRRDAGATTAGFVLDADRPDTQVSIGHATFRLVLDDSDGHDLAYGLAVQDGEGVFVLGRGFTLTLVDGPRRRAGLLRVEQYEDDGGGLAVTARLNGDETGGGTQVSFPHVRPEVRAEAAVPVLRHREGITRIEVYTY